MGARSEMLWLIEKHTGKKIYDVPTLRAYLKQLGITAQTKTLENIEAIAYHLGVPEARNIPLQLIPDVPHKQRPCKSKLSDREIFDLRNQGETFEAIATLAGISKQGVSERLRRFNSDERETYTTQKQNH
jgi:hypothetical protein